MSEFFDPYNADRPLMMKCSCGRDHTLADHHAEVNADEAAAVTDPPNSAHPSASLSRICGWYALPGTASQRMVTSAPGRRTIG